MKRFVPVVVTMSDFLFNVAVSNNRTSNELREHHDV